MVFSQVQTIGDVSLAVPSGYVYTAGPDFGAMVLKQDRNFWLMAVYTPMPSPQPPFPAFFLSESAFWGGLMYPLKSTNLLCTEGLLG
jgi:hypothetical protein